MSRLRASIALPTLLALSVSQLVAQGVRVPVPYDGQLRTDPDVGNVQGIQRYGRPLKTDPDQGEGYSYHVYPVAHDPAEYRLQLAAAQVALPNPAAGVLRSGLVNLNPIQANLQLEGVKALLNEELAAATRFRDQAPAGSAEQSKWVKRRSDCAALLDQLNASAGLAALRESIATSLVRDLQAEIAELTGLRNDAANDMERMTLDQRIEKCLKLVQAISGETAPAAPTQAGGLSAVGAAAPLQSGGFASETMQGFPVPYPAGPYPGAFDWTDGIRNFVVPLPLPGSPADIVRQGVSITRAKGQTDSTLIKIYHQPLIQIKVRVVEVVRGDSFAAGTILEYVANQNTGRPTLTSGLTANTTGQNFRGISRLPVADLATTAATGTGTLLNLTTEHINALVQLLATEANADVVTAPEVVTLNGQNVEFVSGEKIPFQLGQNVIQGNSNNIQQFFYKHVGTMVSVTPRIVNWGLHGEGQGEQPILAHDILSFPLLVDWMSNLPLNPENADHAAAIKLIALYKHPPGTPLEPRAIPVSAQSVLLKVLNDYARRDVQRLKAELTAERIINDPNCERCQTWKAQDCTIDVSVVVRLSNKGSANVSDGNLTNVALEESNVRAISNVIQLKSGHGVVMAGLIGERETEEVAKVPVLGDVPVVGFLFRNKAVSRLKTEVLIFIEAQVLDPEPHVARLESAHDFLLGQPFVAGSFLDNPLEYGLYRVGFGSYLPPHSHEEQIFWERFGRKVRKIHTHLDDALK